MYRIARAACPSPAHRANGAENERAQQSELQIVSFDLSVLPMSFQFAITRLRSYPISICRSLRAQYQYSRWLPPRQRSAGLSTSDPAPADSRTMASAYAPDTACP